MAVVIHYVDKFYKNRTRLVVLRYIRGDHDGANQAKFLIKIIREYELEKRFGYFISNNAKNYDTTINAILDILLPVLSPASRF